jgi:excinuclease ABC subunit C
MNRQSVVSGGSEDQDVLGISQNGSEVCLQKLEVRQGRLVAAAAFFWPASEASAPAMLNAFITQHYPDAPYVPPLILVPQDWPDKADMEKYLQSLRRGNCRLVHPRRGPASRLLEMARANAEESLRRRTLQGGGQPGLQAALEQLGALTTAGAPPGRIEAFDISNTGSQDRAASMVVFLDGKPQRQQYRLFRLEQAESPDDYMALREALRRRFRRLGEEDFGGRPDLVLVDGGRGHTAAARQVFAEMGLDLAVAGMVKDDRHRTRGLALPEGEVVELAPRAAAAPGEGLDAGQSDRLALLRLLTAIQDEAHRFAGSYRGKLAKKRQTRFSLEGIPGIGPARRRLLLCHFQTIKGVSEAEKAALQAVPGLPPAAAQAVFRHFHPEEGT